MPRRRLLEEQLRLQEELRAKEQMDRDAGLLHPTSDPRYSDLTNRLAAIARELEELSSKDRE